MTTIIAPNGSRITVPDLQPRELFIWRVSILLAALAVLAVLALIVAQYMRLGFPTTEDEFNEATRLEMLFGNSLAGKADPEDQRIHKSLGKFTITSLIHGARIGKLGVCYHTFLAAPIIFIKNPENDREIVPVAMAVDAVNDGVAEYLKLP